VPISGLLPRRQTEKVFKRLQVEETATASAADSASAFPRQKLSETQRQSENRERAGQDAVSSSFH
jgi:hypothetical protein